MDSVFDDNSTLVLLCFHGDGKKEAEGFLSEGICQFLDALVDCERVQVQHSFPKRGRGSKAIQIFPEIHPLSEVQVSLLWQCTLHTLQKKRMKIFFTAFIDWFSHMCISDVNEHICRVSEMLVTFETLAGRGVLESLQLFRICVEHQSLPLFAHLRQNTISFKSGNG